jgi:hypothetical protein
MTKSLKKIEANRKNALQSTGPKTAEGKQIVKFNALKHGLLSKEIIIGDGEGQEDEKAYQDLHFQLTNDLQPVGVLEEILVEKIAICYWRLKRAVRSETGEIRKRLDIFSWSELMAKADQFRSDKQFAPLTKDFSKFLKSSIGISHLIRILQDLLEDAKNSGYLSERSEKLLLTSFDSQEGSLAQMCLAFSIMAKDGPRIATDDPEGHKDMPDPATCKELLIDTIKNEIKSLQLAKKLIVDNEALETEAAFASHSLPPVLQMDKILRYETTIERQLYRAMAQLERLQRQRKGELIPPPINLEISSEH